MATKAMKDRRKFFIQTTVWIDLENAIKNESWSSNKAGQM
jgi:hypothetical protein